MVKPKGHRWAQLPSLHRAAKRGNVEDLTNKLESEDPFRQDSMGRTALHYAAIHGNQKIAIKCVRLLLTCDKVARVKNGIEVTKRFVDIQDENGETALHLAAKRESKKIVEMLIWSAADVNIKSKEHQDALHLIYSNVPSAMVSVLNCGVKIREGFDIGDENVRLVLDFGAVIGYPSEEEKSGGFYHKETQLLSYTLDNSPGTSKEILTHPLVTLFLELKWQKIRFFFWFSVIFHISWLLLYTAFISEVYLQSCPYNPMSNETDEDSENEEGNLKRLLRYTWFGFSAEYFERTGNGCFVPKWTESMLWVLLGITGIVAAKEIFEMFSTRSCRVYIRGPENMGQWLLVCFILILSWPVLMSVEVSQWYYEVAAAGILVAWSLILSQLGKHPKMGLYVEILNRVLKNFLWFMLVFASLLFAFALSFSLLLPGNQSFVSLPLAFMKIIVMMTGELNYDELFSEESTVAFPVTARLTYLLFVVVVSITLFNLLIGFTVSDIQGLQKKAEVNRLSNQVEQILLIESFLVSKLLQTLLCRGRRFLKRFLVIPPSDTADDEALYENFELEISISQVPLELQKSIRFLGARNASSEGFSVFDSDDEGDDVEAIVKTVVREIMKKKGLL